MGVRVEDLSRFLADVGGSLAVFWPLLTVIGTILGAVVAGLVAPILQEDDSFKQIRDWAIKPGLAARYRDLIAIGLHAATRFYGPARGLSWEGYAACLLVAFFYPFFLWQLAWCLDGPGTIAGTSAFDETIPSDRRCFGLVVFWVVLIIVFHVFGKISVLHTFIKYYLIGIFRRTRLLRSISGNLVGAVGGVGATVVVSALTVVCAFGALTVGGTVGAVVTAGAAGVAIIVGVLLVIGRHVAVGVAGVLVMGVAVGISGTVVVFDATSAPYTIGPGDHVLYFTFVLILPMVNAVLDYASVQVSRWLLSDLLHRAGAAWQRLMVFGHIMADVIAAAVFLVILAVLLPVVLQLANRTFDALALPVIEWGLYLDAARREPFGAGLLVTGMLATTLIPTVLHLLAAGGALALPQIGSGKIQSLADKAETTLVDRVNFLGLLALSVFLSWAMLVVVSFGLWEAGEAFLGPLGGRLAGLAEGVGRAVGGPGAPGS